VGETRWALTNAKVGGVKMVELVRLPEASNVGEVEVSVANTLSGVLEPVALRRNPDGTFEALVRANGNNEVIEVQITLPGELEPGNLELSTLVGGFSPQFDIDPAQNTSLEDDGLNPQRCDGWFGQDQTSPAESNVLGVIWDVDEAGSITPREILADGLDAFGTPGEVFSFDPQDAASSHDYNPTEGPGNAWSSDQDLTDPLWQFATFRDTENFLCSSGACTKRFWNIALGIDPAKQSCSVEFMATAARSGHVSSGFIQSSGQWPIIRYKAKLTGTSETDNIICRQNPLDGDMSGVFTDFVTPTEVRFCHAFSNAGVESVPGCQTVFPDGNQ
jgi:hypothetical protein